MTPKVSVIVPVYNVEKYLPRCLDSLVNQTLEDIEIICVNDGSTDNSLAILQEYAAKDGRIKIIDKENSGPGDCRNRGIEAAKGEFIAFVDSDDWVEPETYEKTYAKAKKEKCPLVSFNACIVNKKGRKTPRFYYETEKEFTGTWKDIQPLIFKTPFHSWHFLFKRDFLNENNIRYPALSLCEDVPFVLKSLLCAEKISFIPDIFYNYFMLQTSLIHKTTDKIFDLLHIIPLCEKLLIQYVPENDELINGLSYWKQVHLFRIARRLGYEINPLLQNFYINKISELCTQDEFNKFIFNAHMKSEKIKLFGRFTILSIKHKQNSARIRLFGKITILTIKRTQCSTHYYLFGFLLFSLQH